MTSPTTDLASLTPAQALARVRPELAQSKAPSPTACANPVQCAHLALAALPALAALRPSLVALVGQERAAVIDRLELHALATLGAATAWMAAGPDDELATTVKQLQRVRAALLAEARILIRRGTLPPRALSPIANTTGYQALAFDALLLTALLERVAATTPLLTVGSAELAEAQTLADRLMRRTGDGALVEPEAAVRDQAFALLAQTYDEVRRLVSYLRWNERDADQIVPSMWFRPKKARNAGRLPSKV